MKKIKQAPNHSWLSKGLQAFPVTKHQIIPEIDVLPHYSFFLRMNPIIRKLEVYPAIPPIILFFRMNPIKHLQKHQKNT